MRYFKITFAIMLSFLAGCTGKNELAEALLECQDISLTWKGIPQVTYDSGTFQLGYNSSKHEYRVYDDKLAYWFIISCSEKPTSEGQTLKADISWTGASKTYTYKNIQMTVKKTDTSGQVWLWNQSEALGIMIKNI